ncbi:MAG: lipid-A-disaccharide synthase, partial [Calditrichia bacterium]
MNNTNNKILIIAGEVSGDRHAADLVQNLKKIWPDLRFSGIGGDRMEAAGVKLLYHNSRFAVLGLAEIIRHIPFFRSVLTRLKQEFNQVAAVILIDYPGFNLRVARLAKKSGLPVIYYICPQMWAWGEGRIKKFKKFIDLPLVIFKFEETFFRKHGINAHFVGHPLVDQITETLPEADFRAKYNLPEGAPIVGIFPGSRENEVKLLLPVMAKAVSNVQVQFPDIIPVVASAPHLSPGIFSDYLAGGLNFVTVKGDVHSLMKHSYAALVASGTATLELGYLQTPAVVLYRVSPFTYWLGRRLVKINNIALANIVLNKTVFPELIQHEANVDRTSEVLLRYFNDGEYYKSVETELGKIR